MGHDQPPNANAKPPPESQSVTLTFDMATLGPELKPLWDLWNEKRAGAPFPAKSALTPRDLRPWLSGIHLYDVLENQCFRARLLGTSIVAAIGVDQTGRSFGPQDTDLLATRATTFLCHVVANAKPLHTQADRVASTKTSWHSAESLWLPIGNGALVEQVLAATVLTRLT